MSIGSMMFRRFASNTVTDQVPVQALDGLYYRIMDGTIQTSSNNTSWTNSTAINVLDAYILNYQIFWTQIGYLSDGATPGYLYWAWLGSISSPFGSNSSIRDSVIANTNSLKLPSILST